MALCSFLSTSENKIDCFGECAFYNWEDNGGACPFKNLTGNRFSKVKDIISYDIFGEDTINVKDIEHYYRDKEYI
jgi:hypothetical protein